jgi:hypothetical protein
VYLRVQSEAEWKAAEAMRLKREAELQAEQEVTVRFQSHPGKTAGGIFGLWMLLPASE